MNLSDTETTALRCAHADLIGALQAHEACDRTSHDWEAHLQSITDLEEAFPDILMREDTTPSPDPDSQYRDGRSFDSLVREATGQPINSLLMEGSTTNESKEPMAIFANPNDLDVLFRGMNPTTNRPVAPQKSNNRVWNSAPYLTRSNVTSLRTFLGVLVDHVAYYQKEGGVS
jgi:hypothetical protein